MEKFGSIVESKRDCLSETPKTGIQNDLPLLYLITDRYQTDGRPLIDVLKSALEGGVRLIQLREKDLSGRALYNLAIQVRQLTSSYGAKLLINDRLDIAMAVNADGVHLPSNSFTPREARNLLGAGRLIGVSAHSEEDAVRAKERGADFISFSPVYYTPSKAAFGKPQGIERLRAVCNRMDLPVFALGGINAGTVDKVVAAGACGVAVISAILSACDVREEAGRLIGLLNGRQTPSHIFKTPLQENGAANMDRERS